MHRDDEETLQWSLAHDPPLLLDNSLWTVDAFAVLHRDSQEVYTPGSSSLDRLPSPDASRWALSVVARSIALHCSRFFFAPSARWTRGAILQRLCDFSAQQLAPELRLLCRRPPMAMPLFPSLHWSGWSVPRVVRCYEQASGKHRDGAMPTRALSGGLQHWVPLLSWFGLL